MKLEINDKHKKIDFKSINKNALKAKVLSSLLAVTLFTGCTNQISKNNTDSINDTTIEENIDLDNKIDSILDGNIVSVPQSFYSLVKYDKNTPVTKEYLESLKELSISTQTIKDKDELLWINYCTNLESLKILSFNDDLLESIYPLPNLKQLALYNAGNNTVTLDTKHSKILFSPNLEYLAIQQYNVEKGLIEKLENLKILDIAGNNDAILSNMNLDYEKLTNLKAIIINNPYTLAIHLDNNELNALNNANVKLIDRNYNVFNDKIKEINDKIDQIVSTLDIDSNSSEKEKLEKAIIYVLDNLTYDSNVLNSENNNTNLKPFYIDGILYGALELDTAICGNYAALLSVLCDRLNINEILQMSEVHAWNLVYVDGNNYYIDSTLIDNYTPDKVSIDEVKKSSWYLENPNNEMDYTHTSMNLSDLIKIEPITILDNVNISNNSYKLSIGNKVYTIPGGVLIGLFTGLGLAYQKKKNEDMEELNENEKRM